MVSASFSNNPLISNACIDPPALNNTKLAKPYKQKYLRSQELSFLYPTQYQNKVEEVKRHYLPSILEILQRGQGERMHEKGDTYQKVFYNGFSDAVKKKKFLEVI